jgi:thymidylate synthase (FAD)
MMKVVLVDFTSDSMKVLGKTIYWKYGSVYTIDDISGDDAEKFIQEVLSNGNDDILKHVKLTFAIDDVSIVTLLHIMNYYDVDFTVRDISSLLSDDVNFIIPPEVYELTHNYERWLNDDCSCEDDEFFEFIGADGVTYGELREFFDNARSLYDKLISMGVSQEKAVLVLPLGVKLQATLTLNMLEFKHLASREMCELSRWDVGELVNKMWEEVYNAGDDLRKLLKWAKIGPMCIQLRHCPLGEDMPEGCLDEKFKWWNTH